MGACHGYIPDGYTEDFYIKGVPGLYPDMKGTMRRMLGWECSEMWQRQGRVPVDNAKARDFVLAKAVMSHVLSWDFQRPVGDAMVACDLSADSFVHMVPAMRARLAQIVMGNEPDDSCPVASPQKEEWEKEMDAYVAGKHAEAINAGN